MLRVRLGCLVKTDDGIHNIEVNTGIYNYLHRRNLAYISNRYGNGLKVGEPYSKMVNFIQINLTSAEESNIPPYEKYLLRGEITNLEYVDNFEIYEFNLPKLKDSCYNNYKFISLLDLEEDELKITCEGDKVMEKFEKEIHRLNDDEEENEALRKTYIEQGEKTGKQEIAKAMLKKGMDIITISEITGLTEGEINNL